jgi:urease subunit alpha
MAMVSHNLNPRLPEDIAFAESRIRHETIAAEGVLHDIGAISAIGSDSQGMGRIGETISRTWQMASRMKVQRGALPEDSGYSNDNTRIKRFIAKYTINPARMFGVDKYVGSLEPGKLADIIFWKPGLFGIKPEVVFKCGFPVMAVMGEANATLYCCEPLRYRPQWGWFGRAASALSVRFMSQLAIDSDVARKLDLRARCLPVTGTRKLSKKNMLWNDNAPKVTVDPETYRVEVDGKHCTSLPASKVPLSTLYTLK